MTARIPRRENADVKPEELEETVSYSAADPSSRPALSNFGSTDAPGRLPQQFGRYRIEKQLGGGGMGAVYLAHDTTLDRPVALKIPLFDREEKSSTIKRFHREARAMASLRHPNLCPVYDVGEVDGLHYLTMAVIDGDSLAAKLVPGEPVESERCSELVRKLALALDAAHSKGIIHRDLKPANIMVQSDGEPVIMDFGLASRRNGTEATLTPAGAVLGTPAYMAPEQAAGDQELIGPTTDVYALGAILYQLLTGHPPFSGPVGSVLAKILTESPKPLRELNPRVAPSLEAVCQRSMARAPQERYQSAAEVAADLESISGGNDRTVFFKNRSRFQSSSGRWASVNWRQLISLAGVGLVVLHAGAGFYLFHNEPPIETAAELKMNSGDLSSREIQGSSAALGAPDQSWRRPPSPRRYPSLPDLISAAPPWLLDDKKAPFDLAEHFQIPIWEDNAAPLYLAALYEFDPGLEVCFTEQDRMARTPVIANREKRFLALHRQWRNLGSHPTESEVAELRTDVDQVLTEFEPALKKMIHAQKKVECDFDSGVLNSARLQVLGAARNACRFVQLLVWRRVDERRIDEAVDSLAIGLRMSNDLKRRGSLLTILTQLAVDGVLHDCVDVILRHPDLASNHCDRLFELMTQHEKSIDESIRIALQQEYVLFRIMIHDLRYATGDFSPETIRQIAFAARTDRAPAAISEVAKGINAMAEEDFEREVQIANEAYAKLLDVFDEPIYQRQRYISRLWDETSRNPHSKIFRFTMPTLSATFQSYQRNRAVMAGKKSLILVRRWRLSNDGLPPDLHTVFDAAGMSEVPIDPFGKGQALQMAVLDGVPVVYSVGGDGHDDQGLVEWDHRPDSAGDMIFRLD